MGVRRLAVVNGPNSFQMLLVIHQYENTPVQWKQTEKQFNCFHIARFISSNVICYWVPKKPGVDYIQLSDRQNGCYSPNFAGAEWTKFGITLSFSRNFIVANVTRKSGVSDVLWACYVNAASMLATSRPFWHVEMFTRNGSWIRGFYKAERLTSSETYRVCQLMNIQCATACSLEKVILKI